MGANEIAQMGTIEQIHTMELLWDPRKKNCPPLAGMANCFKK